MSEKEIKISKETYDKLKDQILAEESIKMEDVYWVDGFLDKKVLIRTYSAGVHYGNLVKVSGKEVLLKNSRRIWSWQKAFTLSEIAVSGCSTESKISTTTPYIYLSESIEIIPMTSVAINILDGIKDYET